MKFRFVCEEHAKFGGLGFRLESQPDFDPLRGMGVAHDTLEHFPSTTESPADEFMALGAALYIRGKGNYWARKGNINPPGVHVASDMPEILRHVFFEGMSLPAPTRKGVAVDPDLKDYIEQFKDASPRDIRDEFGQYPQELRDALRLMPVALAWIKIGFAKARRRYRGIDPYRLASFFMEVESAVDKALAQCEGGEILEVTLNVRGNEVKTRLIYPEDEY